MPEKKRGTRNAAGRATGTSRYFSEECVGISAFPGLRASKKMAVMRLEKHFNLANTKEKADEEEISAEPAAARQTIERNTSVRKLEGDAGTAFNTENETESRYFGHVVLNLSEDSSSESEHCGSHGRGKTSRQSKKTKGRRPAGKAKIEKKEPQERKKRLPLERTKKYEVVAARRKEKDVPLKVEAVELHEHEEESRYVKERPAEKEDVSAMTLVAAQNIENVNKCVAANAECQAVSGVVKSTEQHMVKDVQPACPSDSDVDWEEVDGMYNLTDVSKTFEGSQKTAAARDIEITFRSQTKQDRMTSCLQRAVAKYRREIQLSKHQVHLLCLLAILRRRNNLCNNHLLQAFCLSAVPADFLGIKQKKFMLNSLSALTTWFTASFQYLPGPSDVNKGELLSLLDGIAAAELHSALEFSMVLVALLRLLGFRCRLMTSMQPVSLKVSPLKAKKGEKKAKDTGKKGTKQPKLLARTKQKRRSVRQVDYQEMDSNDGEMEADVDTHNVEQTVGIGSASDACDEQMECRETETDVEVAKLCSGYQKCQGSSVSKGGSRMRQMRKRTSKSKSMSKGKSKKRKIEVDDSDSDFETRQRLDEEEDSDKSDCIVSKNHVTQTKRTVIDSNFGQAGKSSSTAVDRMTDFWVEIYLLSVTRWICINPVTGVVDSVEEIRNHVTHPMSYVIGVENDGSVKDVTARYVSDWMTGARMRRVNSNWWKQTLLPFQTNRKKDDQREDSLMQATLEKLPFPDSIGHYKNHPLYALKRHLLKFEALYPEREPLGFFKGEAIYSRQCVQTLHSRETWLKYARMVKAGEQPYKMVKQRPKRNEPQHFRDQLRLEVFGEWQTEPYKSDPVKNGKVPRNAYGNVYLFQPSMLPPGAVHVQIPNIQRVARKLGIDHAQAMVGWDVHGGFSHPLLDGVVVAEEFEQTLLDAWEEQQEELEKKAAQKREKTVMGRWRKMIRGLLIQERLKMKYDFQDEIEECVNVVDLSNRHEGSTGPSQQRNVDAADLVGCLVLPPVIH